MLPTFFIYWVRLALPFYAKNISFRGKEQLAQKGPLILAVNHPNSFLDAILLGAFMHDPVHFLARGDVFRIGWVRWFLTQIRMLPIYRIRDGKDKLSLNDQTFEKSREVLEKNGILLVFVEGFCEHQTTLQLPLKKGAPRVIDTCWRQGIPVRILPVWIQYSSFTAYPKQIVIRMGAVLDPPGDISNLEPSMVWQKINETTTIALQELEAQAVTLETRKNSLISIGLFLPAMLAAILHAPFYLPLKSWITNATRNNVHYDSIMLAVMVFTYPIYLLIIAFILNAFAGWPFFFLPLVVMPLLARCYVVWR